MNKRSNELSNIEWIKQPHRALAVLRLMARQPGTVSNDRVISDYLDSVGLVSTREELVGCLDRLEANELITRRDVEKLIVVELTLKGEEVAQGHGEAEGVLRPSVDCPY